MSDLLRLDAAVPRRPPKKERRVDTMTELQSQLLGDIGRAMVARNITNAQLRKAGAPTQQAINKWQHGSSPKLESLEAIAAALGSKLIVVIPGVSGVAPTPTTEPAGTAGTKHSRQAAFLAEQFDAIPEAAQAKALVRALAALGEPTTKPKKRPKPRPAQPRGSTRIQWTGGTGAR